MTSPTSVQGSSTGTHWSSASIFMSADRQWQSSTVPGTETTFWSQKGLGNQVRSNEFVHYDRSKLLSLKQIMPHVQESSFWWPPQEKLQCWKPAQQLTEPTQFCEGSGEVELREFNAIFWAQTFWHILQWQTPWQILLGETLYKVPTAQELFPGSLADLPPRLKQSKAMLSMCWIYLTNQEIAEDETKISDM